MKSKLIYVLLLLLVALSLSAVSAEDIANDTQEIQSVSEEIDLETNGESIQSEEVLGVNADNSTLSSGSAGTFDDLQQEIDGTAVGQTLKLYRDYNGAYGARIQISKSITIDGQGHTLDCKKEGGCSAFYINDGMVTLKNLIIINGNNDYEEYGGAVYSKTPYPLVIDNCTFESNYAGCYGGAVSSISHLTVTNSTFKYNHADRKGGAIYAKECTVRDSTFDTNYAAGSTTYSSDGGAVYAYDGNIVIYNSVFNANEAENYGGAIYTEHSLYINWDAPKSNVSTFFTGNIAQNKRGGAVYAQDVYVQQASFTSNAAYDRGGAIYANGYSYIRDSEFDSNYFRLEGICYGGAIYSNYLITVGGSTFINNPVNYYETNNYYEYEGNKETIGGAIYADESICLKENNSFIRNHDGAIRADSIYGEVKYQLFQENIGRYSALWIDGESDIKMSYCNFVGNHGTVIESSGKSNMVVSSCSFERNILGIGGHVFYFDSSKSNIELLHNFFILNYDETSYSTDSTSGITVKSSGTISKIYQNVIVNSHNHIMTNFYTDNNGDFEQEHPVNVILKYDPNGFKLNQSCFVNFTFLDENYKQLSGDLAIFTGAQHSDQNVEIKNAVWNNNVLTLEIVPHQTGVIRIDNDFNLPIDFIIEPVYGSSVTIDESFSGITLGGLAQINFSIENRTTVSYTISDESGEIEGSGISSNFVLFYPQHAGKYKLTVYNKKNAEYLGSNDTIEFTVDKAKKGLSITVSNTTNNSTVQGIISTQAIGNVTVTINGETKTIEHKGGLSIFTWDKLPVGDYTATATLLENGDYYSVNATTNFVITREGGLKFVLIANSTDVKYGEDIKLSADITSGATGNITYTYINGTVIGTYDVGESVILRPNRSGSHTIIANYSGDDIYNNDSAMIMFIVHSLENDIKISVENVTGVDHALITITGSVNGGYTLTIDSFSRQLTLVNGSCTYNATGLSAGNHTVMVNYTGSLIYKPNTVKAHFSVNKADVKLKIIVPDMKYDMAETGYIFSTVDGVHIVCFNNETIYVTVNNGVGEFYVALLDVGNYVATVRYDGSEYYNSASNTTEFNVTAGGTEFDIGANATNIAYGESVEIYVDNISTGISGAVNYYLINGTFLGTKSSSENLTLSDLNAGTYVIIANFTGDENINSTTSILKITVNKASVTVTVKTENVTYGENATFNITGPNGTYKLSLDEDSIVFNITSGNATENVGILAPGTHYAMIYYEGDENHAEAMEIVTFEVYKLTPKVTVETNDINYKEEAYVNITSDVSGVFYVKIAGQTQSVILTKDEKQTLVFRGPNGNESGWIIEVTCPETQNYTNLSDTSAKLIVHKIDTTINVTVKDVEDEGVIITFIAPYDIDGNVIVSLNGETYSGAIDENRTFTIFGLPVGTYTALINFTGNDCYNSATTTVSFNVSTTTIEASDMTRGYNSGMDYQVKLVNGSGPVSGKNITFTINGRDYVVTTDANGIAKLNIKLAPGTYKVVITNFKGKSISKTLNIVKRITGNKNINTYYAKNYQYKLRVFGDDGKAVGSGVAVKVTINGKVQTLKTDKNGYITVKFTKKYVPKTYKVIAEYKGFKVSNNIKVKQILKLKKVTVKKSAKKLVLKATLKEGKKALKNKKVTFKFKGKKYTVKTNKKGIAKVTIKKSVLKKLKVGKKVKYQVTYLKDTVKRTVKVKK